MNVRDKKWMVQKDTCHGIEKFPVDERWLYGVKRLEDIATLFLPRGTRGNLLVTYKGGDVVSYDSIFGVWGRPIKDKNDCGSGLLPW